MRSLLYLIAVVLVVLWAIGYVAFDANELIHGLLVIAIIVVLVRVIQGSRV